ncbi:PLASMODESMATA CALLOSE-BINDING PROTEIN 3-like [Abrus precatorius]|uniref:PLASMODESMATA CALLOSE-BINDING PROTEIN 3-like n=1 Tax=Abrus precatorius TaxID=3816 RepID=A0A8B8JWJ3_ABRPR|nr:PLASMODESMATA CALLOSE-BINDING PROTEIN 3-like [Abrus precatorius]
MGVGAKVVCLVMVMVMVSMAGAEGGGSWCVAKIGASEEELQRALDSACGGGGAACVPIQPDGPCYIPNTLQAHASYAFNSFYQRNAGAPHACHFAGTSTIAQTDPSYGSCVYPSSATPSSTSPMNNPNVPTPTATPLHGAGGLSPGMNPQIPENSRAPSKAMTTSFSVFLSSLLILHVCAFGFVRCNYIS